MQTRNQVNAIAYVERISIKSEYQAQAYEAKSQNETYFENTTIQKQSSE